jgi:uncharacterized protein YggT (Ycf19 family)
MVVSIIADIIIVVSNILIGLILARTLLSWVFYFGYKYNTTLGRIFRFLTDITEPIVSPVRRFIARFVNTGPVDLAPLVTFFIIIIVSRILVRILLAFM